ncbi:MAG: hypothetical protein U0Q16_02205 [Bryobacteraceae bacterium]
MAGIRKMQSGFHGTTVVKIDERLAGESPKLESATFPGWYTVLRQGWGNGKESAVWSVNGTHYSDHRHQDMGATVMYLLGAPVSIDWGSTYSPQVPGAYQHSLVLPEGAIGQAWDADNTALNGGTMVWEKGGGGVGSVQREQPDGEPVREQGRRGVEEGDPVDPRQ